MEQARLITRAELIDVGHELAHAIAKQSFRPGSQFALIQSATCLAMVTPFPFATATERLAVASSGPLFDLRIAGVIKTNSTDEVSGVLTDYLDASDTGEDGSDAALFRLAMEQLRDHDDAQGEILDAMTVAIGASRTAAQVYNMRRKALAKIVFDLRALEPTQALVFASDAVSRLMINFPPEVTTRDLSEWLVEQQSSGVLGQEVTRVGRITSPLTREPKP